MSNYSADIETLLLDDIDYSVLEGFLRAIEPDPIMTVSEWADTNRVLPATVAEPGPWRTSRTPYLKEIMDKLSVKDPAREIWWQKPSQVGATEAGNNWLGYIIDIAAAATMYVMPTDHLMKKTSKTRIQPMIKDSDKLRAKIKPSNSKEGGNTILDKEFDGGYLTMIGANSAVGLSSTFVRFLYMDELDRYPQDVDGEGDVIGLAKTRTSTFGDRRKIFGPSTPTIDGLSIISKEIKKTGQRHFFVPCLACGTMQYLKFSQLRYEEGKYTDVRYECEHCSELIPERQKTKMLAAGEWKALFPEKEDGFVFGYVMNALYSPLGWYSWSQMAKEHDEAQNDLPKLIVFTNTKLGETYKIKGEQPDWEALYNKRETYKINTPNNKVVLITAGMDVQPDRIEVEIVGWGKGKESWSIDYRVFYGSTNSENDVVWDNLKNIVNEQWTREDGAMIPLRMIAVDSGNNTNVVYSVCRKFDKSKVIPIKGRDTMAVMVSQPKAVDTAQSGKTIKRVEVWSVGVSLIKTELYGWLKSQLKENQPVPFGYCHFPMYDENHFKSLTAEKIEYTKDKKGYTKPKWVKKFDRNERLDCRVYARAAANVAGMDRWTDENWEKLYNNSLDTIIKVETKPKQKKKPENDFWRGR